MITYVDSKNNGMYQTRFEQATLLLRENNIIGTQDDITTLEEYFLYLRDLALLDPYYTMLPVDEETLDIDANTRKIAIPADFAKNGLGVQGDEIAEVVYFTIDRFFDATDLSDPSMQIAIQWQTADGVAGVSKEFVRDITSYPGKLIFGWPLVSEITTTPGTVKFSVRFYKVGERTVRADNGAEITQQYLTYNFNTIPAELKINASLDYALYGESKIDAVDRESLIVNRIVNSVLTDPSIPDADVPVWRLNLSTTDLSEYMPAGSDTPEQTAQKEIERGKYLIKDLAVIGQNTDPETGVVTDQYGYYLEAYATGNGSVSYGWLRADIDVLGAKASEDGAVANVNNSYYVPAAPGPMDSTKSYYIAVGNYETVSENYTVIFTEDHESLNLAEYELGQMVYDMTDGHAYQRTANYGWVQSTIPEDLDTESNHEEGDVETCVRVYERATSISGYKPQPYFNCVIDEEGKTVSSTGTIIQLYERHSRALADSAGLYHVVATNRRLGKYKQIDSYTIIIPMPRIPVIKTEESEDTVTCEGTEMNVVNDDGEIIHVLLDGDEATLHVTSESPEVATAAENGWPEPVVNRTFQWYTDEELGADIYTPSAEGGNIPEEYRITSNGTDESYELVVEDPDHYDQIFFVKVTNNRNLGKAFKYSLPYRVTPAPGKPILLAPLAVNGNIKQYRISETVSLSVDSGVQSDEYTYQWKRFNAEGNELPGGGVEVDYGADDIAIDGAIASSYTPSQPGIYYCEITNHLNGSANMARTPFYQFQLV